jgi:hypothetical protein
MKINQAYDEGIIVVGDKVDLVAPIGQVFRTMIEDRVDNGPFLAGVPFTKGVYMPVEEDDTLYLVFYRETGRYIAQMKVVALEKRGEVRYMWLVQKALAQKNQRREAFRLPVSFDVQIFEYIEDGQQGPAKDDEGAEAVALEVVSSRDISVTGIALLTRKKYELEENYLLGLHIERANINVRGIPSAISKKLQASLLTATVKRCIPWRTSNMFNTGMHFFGMTDAMSDGLARYVLAEQQRQIKRRSRFI